MGCNQVLGLDPPEREATVDAAGTLDAASGDDAAAVSIDARLIDAAIDAPVSSCGPRGTPCGGGGGYCNGAGACVACTTNTHCGNPTPMSCTIPTCSPNDTCTTGPAPRDTFCNNWADQCDGAGNCVDCTNNGGCGECCACFEQVCRPV